MSSLTVLLDRDGTIIVERNYLADPAKVTLEYGALEGLRILSEAGATLAVVTNQSGIGRGYFGEEAAVRVNQHIASLLAPHGISIAGWYMCPHAPDQQCDCRKPAAGLVRRAAAELSFDPARAYIVGDKASDVELSIETGIVPVLVLTGYGIRTAAELPDGSAMIASDLTDAASQILVHHEHYRSC